MQTLTVFTFLQHRFCLEHNFCSTETVSYRLMPSHPDHQTPPEHHPKKLPPSLSEEQRSAPSNFGLDLSPGPGDDSSAFVKRQHCSPSTTSIGTLYQEDYTEVYLHLKQSACVCLCVCSRLCVKVTPNRVPHSACV